jgi:hypothetical protein
MNTQAVVSVGDGRGFIVSGKHDRFIITAAHCLPAFPPCASFSTIEERTYATLVGMSGRGKDDMGRMSLCRPNRRHRGSRRSR